jgi:hypothetical protein
LSATGCWLLYSSSIANEPGDSGCLTQAILTTWFSC